MRSVKKSLRNRNSKKNLKNRYSKKNIKLNRRNSKKLNRKLRKNTKRNLRKGNQRGGARGTYTSRRTSTDFKDKYKINRQVCKVFGNIKKKKKFGVGTDERNFTFTIEEDKIIFEYSNEIGNDNFQPKGQYIYTKDTSSYERDNKDDNKLHLKNITINHKEKSTCIEYHEEIKYFSSGKNQFEDDVFGQGVNPENKGFFYNKGRTKAIYVSNPNLSDRKYTYYNVYNANLNNDTRSATNTNTYLIFDNSEDKDKFIKIIQYLEATEEEIEEKINIYIEFLKNHGIKISKDNIVLYFTHNYGKLLNIYNRLIDKALSEYKSSNAEDTPIDANESDFKNLVDSVISKELNSNPGKPLTYEPIKETIRSKINQPKLKEWQKIILNKKLEKIFNQQISEQQGYITVDPPTNL